jgi:hypothetical protein
MSTGAESLTYVPLDAQYLGGRTADILRDSAATLILEDAHA